MSDFFSKILCLLMVISSLVLLSGCYDEFEIESEESVSQYREYYNSKILPHFESGEAGYFTGVDGIEIAFRSFDVENSNGAIVIFHGKSENMTKYSELVYDLKDTGYSVYLLDHRGQGASGRILNNPMKVYVKSFDDFVNDANVFIEDIVKKRDGHSKLFLIAHSMGGGIASLYLEEYPDVFTGAVLCSAMQSINTSDIMSMTENLAHTMAYLSVLMGKSKDYSIEQEPHDGFGLDANYSDGQGRFFSEYVTHSYKRWLIVEEYLMANPELRAGGAVVGSTWRFINESYIGIKKARKNAYKIKTPLLIFEAGDDHYVTDIGHSKFINNLRDGVLKEFIKFDESIYSAHPAYHEILVEVDGIRSIAVDKIKTFIKSFE